MSRRVYRNSFERAAAHRQRERDARDAERAKLSQRRAQQKAEWDAATIAAILVYREAKAERAARGVTFDGSSGRHPVRHKHQAATYRVAL